MGPAPHDLADLQLAPVALALDERIEQLGRLSPRDLTFRVALESDRPDHTMPMRQAGLLASVAHMIDLHGWQLSWDLRGLRLSHGRNALVLGVPASFTDFIEGTERVGSTTP